MTDKKGRDKQSKENNQQSYIAYGVAFGLLGGSILSSLAGLLFDTPLVWAFCPGIGLMIGIIIGIVMDANKNKEK